MSSTEDQVMNILLVSGQTDWIPIDSAYNAVRYVTGSSIGSAEILRPVLAKLVNDELALPGTAYDEFILWDCDKVTAIKTIDEFLSRHPDTLDSSFEIWFDLTDKGDALAATVPDPFADDPDW